MEDIWHNDDSVMLPPLFMQSHIRSSTSIMQNSAGATSVPAIAAAAAAAAAGACWAVKRALGRPKVAKSGAWSSKISSELIVSKSVRLASASFGKDGALYWLEARPQEGGRRVLVRR